jgi:hypothetical protein
LSITSTRVCLMSAGRRGLRADTRSESAIAR